MEPQRRLLRVEGVTEAIEGWLVRDGEVDRPVDGVLERLVVVGRVGASEEFADFVHAAKDPLYRMAYLLCGDHHRAEELTQQTFERTWRAWPSARDGDPLVYARRVLANQRIDTWRRTRREVLTGVEHEARRNTPDHADRISARDAVVRALLLLPVKQRRVVVLRHLLDLPEAEVAEELGIPIGTVKSTGSRALARLHELMTERDEAGSP